jgi:photosystem II stability/assembly factor-like uncharacterized protein
VASSTRVSHLLQNRVGGTQSGRALAGIGAVFAAIVLSLTVTASALAASPQPQTNQLNSVYFVNATTGWTVGGEGAIFKTVDGGANWIAQKSGTGDPLNSVFFIDANTGWAVGGDGGETDYVK